MAKHTFAFLLLVALGLSACSDDGTSPSGTPSEVVDVPAALDIPIDNDQQAAPREPEVSGILPADFPTSLPLYAPASLINFGSDGNTAWVEMLSPHSRSKVESDLKSRLRAAGWSSQGSGTLELNRSGQKARLTFSDGQPGTLYRYEY